MFHFFTEEDNNFYKKEDKIGFRQRDSNSSDSEKELVAGGHDDRERSLNGHRPEIQDHPPSASSSSDDNQREGERSPLLSTHSPPPSSPSNPRFASASATSSSQPFNNNRERRHRSKMNMRPLKQQQQQQQSSNGSSRTRYTSYVDDDQDNPHSVQLQEAENEMITISGYRWNRAKWLFSWFLIIITCGFARLLMFWKPNWHLFAMCNPCPLSIAQLVLVQDQHHRQTVRMVQLNEGDVELPMTGGQYCRVESYHYFSYRKLYYIWYKDEGKFQNVPTLADQVPISHYIKSMQGLSTSDVLKRILVYGKNLIVVPIKPIWKLLFLEVISPFYMFQVFSVLLWYNDEYYYYATVIVLMSVISITTDLVQIRRTEVALRDMVNNTDMVTVMRDGTTEDMLSDELIPGDVLHIPSHGCTLHCDAILLSGICIVNESMLTGESVPITKTPLADDGGPGKLYTHKEHGKNTLFCGTKVLQTRYYSGQPVQAMVIRTGYKTLKGQLVRSIMYPKPVDFQFTKDLLKFVGVLACIAAVGFVYAIVIMITGGINAVCFDKTGTLTEDGLDLHGVVAVKGEGLLDAEVVASPSTTMGPRSLLIQAMATCHSLTRIEGEITGDPMDLILFRETEWDLVEPQIVEESAQYDSLAPTVVRPEDRSGSLANFEIGILRQFTFSSELQRMSVIVRFLGEKELMLFSKGAPEMIASLCRPETVPSNFNQQLKQFARRGFRVLALAKRSVNLSFVKVNRVKRQEVERDLDFLGLVVLENRLKPESGPVIRQLATANIRTIMVTGDNILTGVSVGRECGILDVEKDLYILEATDSGNPKDDKTVLTLKKDGGKERSDSADHHRAPSAYSSVYDFERAIDASKNPLDTSYQIAMSGPTFKVLYNEYRSALSKLVTVGCVFARMSPDQKAELVGLLQENGYIVAMCGDGANDCGALKAAHAGISLSEAEASIASPFTSKTPDIRCVPIVIREGRAALVTSFGVFKYMAGYSLTQFITVSLLYWLNTNISDFQFLYIDLFLITVLAVFFGYTDAAETLHPTPPPTRILSIPSVASIILHLIVIGAFQVFMFLFVPTQPWFVPFTDPGDEDNYYSFQGTCVFWMSVYQYLTLAVIYSKSYPYRKPIYNNRLFSGSLIILTAVSIWWTLYPPAVISNPSLISLNLMMPPYMQFRGLILVLALACYTLCYLIEKYIVEWLLMEKGSQRHWCGMGTDKPKYYHVLSDIGSSVGWLEHFIERSSQSSRLSGSDTQRSDLSSSTHDESAVRLINHSSSRRSPPTPQSSPTTEIIDNGYSIGLAPRSIDVNGES